MTGYATQRERVFIMDFPAQSTPSPGILFRRSNQKLGLWWRGMQIQRVARHIGERIGPQGVVDSPPAEEIEGLA